MHGTPFSTAPLRHQLRLHLLRLRRLRAWRDAVCQALLERRGDACPRPKALDTTPSTETLEYERDMLDREIRMHTTLIALGRDGRALRLVADVVADPALARRVAGDTRAFAGSRGVPLPRQLMVRVEVVAGQVRVELDYVDRPFVASIAFP